MKQIYTLRKSQFSRANQFILTVFSFLLLINNTTAVTYTVKTSLTGTVNWSATSTWTGGVVPTLATDNIVYQCATGGNVVLNIDIDATVANFTIGSGSSNRLYVQVASGKTLNINGLITVNTSSNRVRFYSGAGTLNINSAATFDFTNVSGGNYCRFYASSATGILNFYPALTITNSQVFVGSSASGANFNMRGDLTDQQDNVVMAAGGNINFYGNYTVSSTNASTGNWSTTSNAYFYGASKTITPTKNVYFGNLIFKSGSSTTIALGAGASSTVTTRGSITLESTSAPTFAHDVIDQGSWSNNGGTLTAATSINVYLTAASATACNINGTSSTTFPALHIGYPSSSDTWSITYNMSVANTCYTLTIEDNSSTGSSRAYTLNHSAAVALTVSNNATIKQQNYTGGTTTTNAWNINTGSSVVSGNLVFSNGSGGSNNTTKSIAKVAVTSGSLTVTGSVTWLAQTGSAAVATEVISLTTGSITFSTSLSMPQGSGTLAVSNTGTINFNGGTAPSYSLNAAGTGATNAILTTTTGCTLNFINGFTNANSAVIIANGSYSVFTGTGTITPTAAITFGNFTINATPTVTLAGNIVVTNNWLNNGGTFTPSTNTVTFTPTAGVTQTITKTGGETFYRLAANLASATLQLNNDVTVTNTLDMSGHTFNLNGNTLQLGSGSNATLNITGVTKTTGFVYGGNFKRYWASGTSITSAYTAGTGVPTSSGSNYGLFPIGISGDLRAVYVNTPVTAPTGSGYITASHNNVISVNDVTYTDNQGVAIVRYCDESSTLTNSGVTGGTYNVEATFNNFISGAAPAYANYRLLTLNGGVLGSAGSDVVATGVAFTNPILKRTGLTITEMPSVYIAGTKDIVNNPLEYLYYWRNAAANSNWNSASNWSTIGPASATTPASLSSSGYYIVGGTGFTGATLPNINATATAAYVDVRAGGYVTSTTAQAFTVSNYLITSSTGYFNFSTGTLTFGASAYLTLAGTGSSSIAIATSIPGLVTIGNGTSLTLSNNVTFGGNLILNGTITENTNTLTLSGTSATITATSGIISGTGSLAITDHKTIVAGSTLTINTTASLSNNKIITNNANVTMTNAIPLTGGNGSSQWTNALGSTLTLSGVNATGTTTFLAVGTLDASASTNTVNWSAAGSQVIKAPTSGYSLLYVSTSGTKTISGNLAVNDELLIQNTAILDEGTSTITGIGDLTMVTGTPELRLNRSSSGTYPELTGTYSLTVGTVTLNQTSGTTTLPTGPYYNLRFNPTSIYASSNQTYDMGNVSLVRNNFDVLGAAIWANTLASNLTVTGTTTYGTTGTSALGGDLTTGSFTMNAAGTLADGGFDVVVNTGDWTKSAGTYTATGTASFTGATTQNITGASATTFFSLTINNASALGVTLGQGVTVNDALVLTDGLLNTTGQVLTLVIDATYSANTSLGSLGSFVNGPMRYSLSLSGLNTLTFPVGSGGTDWRPASLDVDHSTNTTYTYTATLNTASADALAWTLPSTIDLVSKAHYLDIVRSASSTDLNSAILTMYYSNASGSFDGVTDYTNLTMAKAPVAGSTWTDIGGTATANNVGSVTSGVFTSFSRFALANKKPGTNPLPVELIAFDAKAGENKTVNVDWSTASEINNDHFDVERSVDGKTYEKITTVKGKGTTASLSNYSIIDVEPYSGVSYYRLKQVDFDGKINHSEIRKVQFNGTTNTMEFYSYPNPATIGEPINIGAKGFVAEKSVLVVLRDVNGREVYSKVLITDSNGGIQTAIDVENKLAAGIYIVVGSSDDKIFNHKLIIK